MTQPTPGPWHSEYDPHDFAPTILVLRGGLPVAEVMFADRHPVSTPVAEALANARLIAAAPRMLAMLKLLAAYVVGTAVEAAVRTTIDDAEGQP